MLRGGHVAPPGWGNGHGNDYITAAQDGCVGHTVQIRVKHGGVLIFSESKVFDTRPQAVSWGDRLEAKVKAEGLARHASSTMTVGDLVRKHLDAQLVVRPLLGRSTIHNHHKIAPEFDKVLLRELMPEHLIDCAIRRKTEDRVTPATIKSALSPVSAAFGVARIAYLVDADPAVIQEAMHSLDKQGLVGKSREVVRWVNREEEEALLAEFARRNAHHQTTIDMAQLYKFALSRRRPDSGNRRHGQEHGRRRGAHVALQRHKAQLLIETERSRVGIQVQAVTSDALCPHLHDVQRMVHELQAKTPTCIGIVNPEHDQADTGNGFGETATLQGAQRRQRNGVAGDREEAGKSLRVAILLQQCVGHAQALLDLFLERVLDELVYDGVLAIELVVAPILRPRIEASDEKAHSRTFKRGVRRSSFMASVGATGLCSTAANCTCPCTESWMEV